MKTIPKDKYTTVKVGQNVTLKVTGMGRAKTEPKTLFTY